MIVREWEKAGRFASSANYSATSCNLTFHLNQSFQATFDNPKLVEEDIQTGRMQAIKCVVVGDG